MAFEITGKLFLKSDLQVISEKFKKREFVLIKEENNGGSIFTDYIKFQLIQDKCDLIDALQLHDEVKVSFNLKGTKWEKNGTTSYFTNLDAWRIEKIATGDTGTSEVPSFGGASVPAFGGDDAGDLPF